MQKTQSETHPHSLKIERQLSIANFCVLDMDGRIFDGAQIIVERLENLIFKSGLPFVFPCGLQGGDVMCA